MAQSNPPTSPSSGGRNRRRNERIVVEGISLEVIRVGLTSRLPVSAAKPAPNLTISLLDLSSGGFRVTTWGQLAKGDRVVAKIKFPGEGKEISARAVVRWVVPIQLDGRDAFDVGCEFVDLDTNDRIRIREMGRGGKQV